MVRKAKRLAAHSVVAYLRVSKDDQALGLDAQRQAVEGWAARQGVQATAWHVDEAISGGNSLADRPALVEAISGLRRGDVLVVAKRDRLARDTFVAAQVTRMVEQAGAKIVSADGIGNGEGPADQLLRHMLDGMAAFERQLIAARTKAALAVKASRGERIGRIPYGSQLAADGLHLEPCLQEQEIIARIGALEPMRSCQAIADALTAEGLFNRSGKPFARQAVHLILTRGGKSIS
jgi:DNA invertase Pin-like site-specific DNA recombinase